MSQAARNLDPDMRAGGSAQEYWRPAIGDPDRDLQLHAEACEHCGSEFAPGARFCHACGAERETGAAAATRERSAWSLGRILDLEEIKAAMGLSLGSLICFFIGVVCTVAAAVVGFVYTASTLLDWQAVQTWRIEWLLTATAAFVAGLLLKKK